MFAELVAYAMSEGKTVPDLLDDVFREYGVYLEQGESIVMEGADGAAKIAALVKSYSGDPPKEVDGSAVVKTQDFATEEIYDEEGDLVPKAGMLVVELEDGRRFAVRPSGTEPKIKYYLFAQGPVGAEDLEAEKARVQGSLDRLWTTLDADAKRRMG